MSFERGKTPALKEIITTVLASQQHPEQFQGEQFQGT
jgi:hypothetical protein